MESCELQMSEQRLVQASSMHFSHHDGWCSCFLICRMGSLIKSKSSSLRWCFCGKFFFHYVSDKFFWLLNAPLCAASQCLHHLQPLLTSLFHFSLWGQMVRDVHSQLCSGSATTFQILQRPRGFTRPPLSATNPADRTPIKGFFHAPQHSFGTQGWKWRFTGPGCHAKIVQL